MAPSYLRGIITFNTNPSSYQADLEDLRKRLAEAEANDETLKKPGSGWFRAQGLVFRGLGVRAYDLLFRVPSSGTRLLGLRRVFLWK